MFLGKNGGLLSCGAIALLIAAIFIFRVYPQPILNGIDPHTVVAARAVRQAKRAARPRVASV